MFTKHSGYIKSCDTDRHNNWQEVSLASACIQVTDGSHFSPIPRSHGRPIANVKDLRPGFVDILSCTKIAEEDFYELVRNGCDVQRHDVLLSKDGTIGRVVVYEQDEPLVALSSIAILRPGKALDPFFLGQVLQSSQVTKQIGIFAGGSALHRLVLRDINRLFIPLPSLAEQQRIAAVLDTVDKAIMKTEAVIAKLKQVRVGLLHDLLTRGLNEHGQLRDPLAHPEQFKDSSLGWIPCVWRVAQLQEVADIASGVTLGRNLDGAGTLELPYLRVANVQDGYLDLADVKTIRIFPDELDRFRLKRDDVLMNEGGDYDKLGRGTVWEDQIPVCLHQNHVFRVRCRSDVLNCYFLAAVSGSETGKRYFLRSSKQSTNLASINSTQLNAFEIPVPSLIEQETIIKILKTQDDQLAAETRGLVKLHALKSGLMADLLTGRVRVPEGIAVAL